MVLGVRKVEWGTPLDCFVLGPIGEGQEGVGLAVRGYHLTWAYTCFLGSFSPAQVS